MNGRQTELPALNTIVDFSRSAFPSPFHNLLKKNTHTCQRSKMTYGIDKKGKHPKISLITCRFYPEIFTRKKKKSNVLILTLDLKWNT